jgi:hypothetical protein
MRRIVFLSLSGMAFCLLLSTVALAGGYKLDNYPLRVHIYSYNAHSHYYERQVSWVDGEGRATLYENGEPKGFDFGYRCEDRLRSSPGYETYYARWKKPGRTLEILLPVFGKPNADESCELKVVMKDGFAYRRRNGSVIEVPSAEWKDWMQRHQYDPEHGKNVPVMPAAKPSNGADDQ